MLGKSWTQTSLDDIDSENAAARVAAAHIVMTGCALTCSGVNDSTTLC